MRFSFAKEWSNIALEFITPKATANKVIAVAAGIRKIRNVFRKGIGNVIKLAKEEA